MLTENWRCDYMHFVLYIAGTDTSQNDLWDVKQLREDYSSFVNKTCIICAWI